MQPVYQSLAALYTEIEEAYDKVATVLDFTCTGCSDNCCDSYFTHHTYLEWAYLWEGFQQLSDEQQRRCRQRAKAYVAESEEVLAAGNRPLIMCPLNEQGLCILYKHRLLICRIHGIPASFSLPNGQKKSFPGCFRCQEVTGEQQNLPTMDRTKFFRTMVALEGDFLGHKRHLLPKLKMTIAAMLVEGPPKVE